jgi:UDP-N-acetylmuramate--L-alanine ligase/UDP-N-acetylenolpyruvoylglucosamine reductase
VSNVRQNSATIIHRFLQKPKGHVHMVGVCGVGMAGVAFLLKARGFKVTGCDAHLNRLAEWLRANGIEVKEGHDPVHLRSAPDWIVRTPAVAEDNPEIAKARKSGIPMFFRGETLPELLTDSVSVAVCGTHGKTTTTTFITQLLRCTGRDPSWCVGGENSALGGVAGVGKGGYLVVEADESDGTLALYRPDIAVVTNIEFDHMEHFESVKAFEDCFRTFIRNARRKVVYCAEDPRARALCKGNHRALSYGLCEGAVVRGTGLKLADSSLAFTLEYAGRRQGIVEMPVPGRHNVLNALATAAVGFELGLTFGEIRQALRKVSLPKRRFEKIAEANGILVISDYAHHPSEIKALVRAALRLKHKRLLAVYQPHRYTRTLALGPDFPPAFEGIDELVLCPVYAASEKPLKGGTIWDLYKHFRDRESGIRNQVIRPVVSVATSLEQAWAYLRRRLTRGDVFLVIGAGDVEKIAGWAGQELGQGRGKRKSGTKGRKSIAGSIAMPKLRGGTVIRFDEPLANKTTMKVGGTADVWAAVGTQHDLALLLGWARETEMPFQLLGAGSNAIVSDLGVRGIVARLVGKEFTVLAEDRAGIRVGAGAPLARLLNWVETKGVGGYEFLEGIPGSVGGALRMNAGAWGQEIGPLVRSVRYLDPDGSDHVITGKKLRFGYRCCRFLDNRIVVEAVLARGKQVAVDIIRRRRAEIAEKRKKWKGLRCAGSVFKNPRGDFAGRWIEAAGLKGFRIGGASVSSRHANVIVTDQGALASDVRCLIETIRSEVERRFKSKLETEVVFLE